MKRKAEVIYLNNFVIPRAKPRLRKQYYGITPHDWVRWVLAQTGGGMSSLDLSEHVPGPEALRIASQDHHDHMDVRLPKRELGEFDVVDDIEGFVMVVLESTPEKEEWRRRFEEGLNLRECAILQNYIELARKEESSPLQHHFLTLNEAKWFAWMLVNEHTDWNMFPWDRFRERLDRDLKLLEMRGKTLKQSALDNNFRVLKKIQRECVRHYPDKVTGEPKVDYNAYQGKTRTTDRNEVGYALYLEAKDITKDYHEWWETEDGQSLSDLKARKREAWALVVSSGLANAFGVYKRQMEATLSRWWCDKEPDEKLDNPLLIDAEKGLSYEDFTIREQQYAQLEGRLVSNYDYEVMSRISVKGGSIDVSGVEIQKCHMGKSGLQEALMNDEQHQEGYWDTLEDPNEVRGHEIYGDDPIFEGDTSFDEGEVDNYQALFD